MIGAILVGEKATATVVAHRNVVMIEMFILFEGKNDYVVVSLWPPFERWEGEETEEHRRATVAEVVGSGDVDF